MILLRPDTRNDNVALTLTEKTTIDNAYYLFEVYTQENREDKQYFLAPDTSDYKESYNKFSLKAITSGIPNQTTGEFLVKTYDMWRYNVYEQASDSNLDPDGLNLVETGLISIDSDRPSAVEFTPENEVINYGN